MMINGNTNCFVNKPLAEDLRERLLNAPELNIRCANDANCFALAEHQLGSEKDMNPASVLFLELDVEPESSGTEKFTAEKRWSRRSRTPHSRYQWARMLLWTSRVRRALHQWTWI